jgi:hypothetical protein
MTLPAFNEAGDLPPAIYKASLDEVRTRFDFGSGKRAACSRRLSHIYALAKRVAQLHRFILFGSYVTNKPEPNDLDIILIMDDEFRLEDCPLEAQGLFDHAVAQARYGASIFWVRPGLLIQESIDEFILYWQVKRDGSRRGIVEIVP